MIKNSDMHNSISTLREGRIGLRLRAAPSTPGKERRRRVVTSDSLDELSLDIDRDITRIKSKVNMSSSLPSAIAIVSPNSPNQCEEGLCRINRKASMKRSIDSAERWSDSFSDFGGGTRKHDSTPSLPSRGEKAALNSKSPLSRMKACIPPLDLTKEERNIKEVILKVVTRKTASRMSVCDHCQKFVPPIEIECVNKPKDLDDEDLTVCSLEDDDFSASL
ncbi:hypothetical protein FisN_2HuN02 [Fistulifera solaris]|uniref:Uncharacterized protein n=1 Tax=Fistulifera solaris TaxID=1519565 RepID=A0A1Z5JG43_FISSO|nr:hypothetical protein FisN_2HuN02 [Fistulifera solaris]|eukprot:GAX12970.1 hypothetical protein FisN_2HuN02 [Fistulifera solaris]